MIAPPGIQLQPGLLNMPAGLGENEPHLVLPMKALVRRIADRWEAAKIAWVVLRNAEGLPEFTRYDLDILMAPDQARKAAGILEECVAETGWNIAGRIRKYHYQCLLLMHASQGNIFYLPVDMFTALQYRGLRYLNTHDILQKRLPSAQGIWCLPPGVEASITLLKELLPHRKLKENSRATVSAQWEQDASGFGQTITAAAGAEWAEKLAQMIRREEWSLARTEALDLRRQIRRRAPPWWGGAVGALWAHIRHLMRPALGRVICLAGPDGSGKTTLAEGLFRNLYKRPFKAARYIHGNIGILPRFRDARAFIRHLLRLPPIPSPPEPVSLKGMMTPLPAWKSVLLATYYACDFSLARWCLRRWRSQWTLTIMDRSFYDYYYQLGHRRCPHRYLHLLARWIPKPDVLLCITDEPAAIHQRKPELTVAEIQVEQDILSDLVQRYSFARSVDGRQGISTMVATGVQFIQQHLFERNPDEREP